MRTLALYVAAGIVYVAIGVAIPDFLYASTVAAVYLVVAVWGIPELVRRQRAR